MAKVYKRTNSPYWWVKIPVLDDAGQVLSYERKSTKRTDKKEARKVADAMSRKILDRDQLGVREAATIEQAAKMYIAELTSQAKPSVKDAHTFVGRVYSKPRCSEPISKLNRSWLSRLKNKRILDGYAASTVNNEMTFWISVFNKAKDDYNMSVDTGASFKNLKLKTTDKTRYFLEGEEQALISQLDPFRSIKGQPEYPDRHPDTQRKLQDQHDLVCFLIDTGARYTEVASIQWSAIDTITWSSINIYRNKVGNEGHLTMTNRLREILQRRFAASGNSYYVFASDTQAHKPRGYSTKGIRKAIERAELNAPHLVDRYGRFTCHSFRHTFASRLVQAGMSLYAVSRLLGHSDTQMTQRYAHLAPSQVSQQAADILDTMQGATV